MVLDYSNSVLDCTVNFSVNVTNYVYMSMWEAMFEITIL